MSNTAVVMQGLEDFPRACSVLEDGRRAGLHHGAQLYVSRGGQTRANLALGESRPGQAMRSDTLLWWRSSTKPVVAIAIALLVDRGLISLTDFVARWIPEFAAHDKQRITIRHLLTHTAGIRTADLAVQESMDWATALPAICAARPEPGTVPGEQAAYHMHSTWFLLGEVIRRADGRSCDRFVREEIFAPLGMEDCWVGMDARRYQAYAERIGVMYLKEKNELRPHPFANSELACALCQPGSNGRGPMAQLGRFYEFLLAARQGKFRASAPSLKMETAREWTSRQRVGMMDRTFRHVIDWGYGFIVNSHRYGAETVPYGYGPHCSEETFGHSGSQSSCAFADPPRELVVAWACNGMPGEVAHQQRARDLHQAIYRDLGMA